MVAVEAVVSVVSAWQKLVVVDVVVVFVGSGDVAVGLVVHVGGEENSVSMGFVPTMENSFSPKF